MLLALSAAVVPGLAANDQEPAYAYTDPYIINYAKTDLGDYSAQAPYLYASPHYGSMAIRNLSSGKMEYWTTSQQVYNLIDTKKLADGGEGAYASLGAYCVDACINAVSGQSYRRTNLESSTYFDDVAAGRIRSVYLHSFPYIQDIAAIQAAVNAWLGTDTVTQLTGAEVITATQIAIWAIANGEDVSVRKVFSYTDQDYTDEQLAGDVVYVRDSFVDCTEKGSDYTAANIQSVYDYLLNLDPTAPMQKTVSETDFLSGAVSAVKQADGSYTVTVKAEVLARVENKDELILTASLAGKQASVALKDGTHNYSLVLTGVTNLKDVALEINGYQTAADVFLFDANGDRSASQSMVAYDDTRHPVHAETVLAFDRELTIHKYAPTNSSDIPGDGTETTVDRTPLANVEFEIYFAYSMADILAGTVKPGATPTEKEIDSITANGPIVTLITDENGVATFNFTGNQQPDGVYLVVEKDNPAVMAKADPFFVSVPMTDPTGQGWLYHIHVYPKNDLADGPHIDKDVTRPGNDNDSFDVNEIFNYIIRADVPKDLYFVAADGTEVYAVKYSISDTLDNRLTYMGNIKPTLLTTEGKELVLDNSHYTITEGSNSFTVSLTDAGKKFVAQNLGSGKETPEIRVWFQAKINENAQLGTDIPNNATVEFTNSTGTEYLPTDVPQEDRPVVYTGGLRLHKYDAATGDTLQGAIFSIARDATAAELADASLPKYRITVDGQLRTVVYAGFYNTADMEGKKVTSVTTGKDGSALMWGLAYGTYYLVEIQAPEGYNLLEGPVAVEINAASHLKDSVVEVANSAEFQLPATGGMGTTLLTTGGVALISLALLLMVISKKKARG